MGTNFYWRDDGDIDIHIGKRSAAGNYCWDCGISLCAAGHHEVHFGSSRFLKECPVCGKKPTDEDLNNSAAGRELGFNENKPQPKTGVRSCCSFSWAMSPGHFHELKSAPNLHIENEYGETFTVEEFSEVLSECPIKYFDNIGIEFC